MVADVFASAIKLHIEGQFFEAAQKYQVVIERYPHHSGALNNLGLILGYRDGLEFFRRAVQANVADANIRNNFEKSIIENIGPEAGIAGSVIQDLKILNIKKSSALVNRDGIFNLVIGSSHGDHAFDSIRAKGSVNLCYTSQDMFHTACVYDWGARHLSKLRTVVIFYSVFSSYFLLQKSEDRWRVAPIKEVFDIDYKYYDEKIDAISPIISNWSSGYLTPNDQFGFTQQYGNGRYFNNEYGVERRAENHFTSKRTAGQALHLVRILLQAREMGHRVLVVIPPCRHDLRAVLHDKNRYFQELHWVREQFKLVGNFDIVDFYDDPFFQYEHFGDFDHLDPQGEGCRYLTDMVMSRIG
ncbi:MAG: tetratricopeptide repeat protein [Niveispirillum sp.]|uniref:tetratricopeptide repeat protein n=1 Tax=Niveispirillum sp. TaxID=1917217 RepID=UPI00403566F4